MGENLIRDTWFYNFVAGFIIFVHCSNMLVNGFYLTKSVASDQAIFLTLPKSEIKKLIQNSKSFVSECLKGYQVVTEHTQNKNMVNVGEGDGDIESQFGDNDDGRVSIDDELDSQKEKINIKQKQIAKKNAKESKILTKMTLNSKKDKSGGKGKIFKKKLTMSGKKN